MAERHKPVTMQSLQALLERANKMLVKQSKALITATGEEPSEEVKNLAFQIRIAGFKVAELTGVG